MSFVNLTWLYVPDATEPVTMYITPSRFSGATNNETKSGGSIQKAVPDQLSDVLLGKIRMLRA